jgi:hypothetical protein
MRTEPDGGDEPGVERDPTGRAAVAVRADVRDQGNATEQTVRPFTSSTTGRCNGRPGLIG